MSDCVCGSVEGTNGDNCERCRLIKRVNDQAADIRRYAIELGKARARIANLEAENNLLLEDRRELLTRNTKAHDRLCYYRRKGMVGSRKTTSEIVDLLLGREKEKTK